LNIKPIPAPVKITIEAQLKPSEDPKKVEEAIKNVIGQKDVFSIKNEKGMLVAEIDDQKGLDNIYEKIRARQNVGVARRMLTQNVSNNNTWIYFHKQAAYVKILNICDGESDSPLGHIKVIINTAEPLKIIDWLAPYTPNIK